MIRLAASLMCADALRLGEEIAALDRGGIDLLHCDVMDGHFVPNFAMSLDVIARVRACSTTPIDVHLMVEDPERYVDELARSGVTQTSFHLEASRAPIRLLRRIRATGMKSGVALNPLTSFSSLAAFLEEVDHILVMTVEPGFAGQVFLPSMLDKIAEIRQRLSQQGRHVSIAVDGNIDVAHASLCLRAGADTLVLGSSGIFSGDTDLGQRTREFRDHVQHAVRTPVAG